MTTAYETDFYQWTQQQAALIRQGLFSELDTAHLIDEIEDMGGSKERELESRLGVLLAHLLKWEFQPARRGNSWRLTIKEQRRRIDRLLKKNPSLKPLFPGTVIDAYGDARLMAAREMDCDDSQFPLECEFTVEQITGDYWPEALMSDLSLLRAFVISVSEHLEKFSQDEIAVSQELSREQEWLERANKLMESYDGSLTTRRPAMTLLEIHAFWDDEVNVWVAESEDVPGLITEAETMEHLVERLQVIILELMELNGNQFGPFTFHLVSERTVIAQAQSFTPPGAAGAGGGVQRGGRRWRGPESAKDCGHAGGRYR